MKSKDKFIAAFGLIVVTLAVYIWFSPDGFREAPSLTVTSLNNEKINLDDLRGKPLLITFWATSCSGCLKEMPHLVELYHKYNPRGLQMIGISMPYDRPDHVAQLVKDRKLPYIIAMDLQGEATKAFGNIQLTPTTFIISPQGKIVKQKIGEIKIAKVEKLIESML